jgi:hypothetical protein
MAVVCDAFFSSVGSTGYLSEWQSRGGEYALARQPEGDRRHEGALTAGVMHVT